MALEMTDQERAALEEQAQRERAAGGQRARSRMAPAADRPVVGPSFWSRLRMYLGAVFGPKVDADTFSRAMKACVQCPELDRAQRQYKIKIYCGACGCPRWLGSRLERKNRHALHLCPRTGHHPGRPPGANRGCAGC